MTVRVAISVRAVEGPISSRRSKLQAVNVSEFLVIFGTTPFVLVPLLENLVQLRRGLIVDDLSVLAEDVEWLSNEIWNVLAHKHVRVKKARIDFRGQI